MIALNYEVKHIGKNKFSRPCYKLLPVKAYVVHYTANHGGTADNHFAYFNNLSGRYASAHIFVDRHKALEIIPLNEVAFHANERKVGPLIHSLKATAAYYPGGNANLNSIGIEMCMEKDGTIHPDTIKRTILVIQKLYKQFGVLPIYRHYDITGKKCPLPFVTDSKQWTKFLADVQKEEDEMQFSSPSLKAETELTLNSKARREIIVNAAVKAGAHESWRQKLKEGTITDADLLGLAAKYIVDTNK
ncbi:N-acetylmuramoyl-L-alanine amidase family protein [Sporosarcina contaminans]|uniref:N-acetylmuramoyl-L-alanine amidase n=1 Tax=Sporosarcina contaminans TaxID=633403 RepID=A0ABW3U3F1_9BACL